MKNCKLSYKLKYSLGAIILCFSAILIFNFNYAREVSQSSEGKKIVLIDPGHGGIDGGAVSPNGTVEKNINLSIALKLREELQNKGYRVEMTRSEDIGLYSDKGTINQRKIEDLNNRCKMKKDTECNMFISIHLNKFQQSQYYGAQVWYSNNEDSKILAQIMQANFIRDLNNGNRRIEKPAQNAYKVLRCYDNMPGVIVECGFLSNGLEEEKLKNDKYQKDIALSLAKSIDDYYNKKTQ